MKKRQPTFTLIIGDDIRAELNGKMSIMGVTQAPIKLSKEEGKDYATHTIAAYGSFDNLQHADNVTIKISDSNDEIVSSGEVPIPKGQHNVLVVAGKFENVRFKNSGKCTISIVVDGQEFSKDFYIVID